MSINDIEVGQLYDWGGYTVEAMEITDDGVVIECMEIGQDCVPASQLSSDDPRGDCGGDHPWD